MPVNSAAGSERLFARLVLSARKRFRNGHNTMAACSPSGDSVDETNDPGAAPYGNFINYYDFNPPENRLSLIPDTLLGDLGYSDGRHTTLILDVGCNSGVCESGTWIPASRPAL